MKEGAAGEISFRFHPTSIESPLLGVDKIALEANIEARCAGAKASAAGCVDCIASLNINDAVALSAETCIDAIVSSCFEVEHDTQAAVDHVELRAQKVLSGRQSCKDVFRLDDEQLAGGDGKELSCCSTVTGDIKAFFCSHRRLCQIACDVDHRDRVGGVVIDSNRCSI